MSLKGDVVLIGTGQARHYHDAKEYLHDCPGINLEAARWLVEQPEVMLLGAANLSLEAFPPERDDNWVPVHTYLLAGRCMESGIRLDISRTRAPSRIPRRHFFRAA